MRLKICRKPRPATVRTASRYRRTRPNCSLSGTANRNPPCWTPRPRWWTGSPIPPLAPEGRAQAELVTARLASAGIDAIYVSTLRRTAETAAPLAARLGLVPRVEAGLREVGLGEWEGGLFRKMVSEHHPMAMRMWAEETFEVIPGAEPATEFTARVRDAVGRLAAAHTGQRVAIFTHGGVIGQVLALASESRPFAFVTSDNGSISRLVVSGDRWIVRGYNDTAHLEPPGQG